MNAPNPLPTDPLSAQFASDAHLRVRQRIYAQYQFPRVDFPLWVLARHVWRGDEHLLDVGSGNGAYYTRIQEHLPDARYTALDRYTGVLALNPCSARVQADAAALPFATAAFDVVLANEMLHFIADPEAAIADMARVLKPGGVLIAAAQSLYDMPQIFALVREVLSALMPPNTRNTPFQPPHMAFGLENGTRLLARTFPGVVRYELPTSLIFDAPGPVLDFIASWRSHFEPQFPSGIGWDDALERMRSVVAHRIRQRGEFGVELISGALVATVSGGFLREFAAKKIRL
ncbi:MAG: class I SAM-dependent methyltransferase [bacterium]|nr:class I SAM-dependent methyltransferase [bacterium]